MASRRTSTPMEVVVHKDSEKANEIGMRLQARLSDGAPVVTLIVPGGAAEASGSLNKGDVVVSINEQKPRWYEHAMEPPAKQSAGAIKLVIERADGRARVTSFSKKSSPRSKALPVKPVSAAALTGKTLPPKFKVQDLDEAREMLEMTGPDWKAELNRKKLRERSIRLVEQMIDQEKTLRRKMANIPTSNLLETAQGGVKYAAGYTKRGLSAFERNQRGSHNQRGSQFHVHKASKHIIDPRSSRFVSALARDRSPCAPWRPAYACALSSPPRTFSTPPPTHTCGPTLIVCTRRALLLVNPHSSCAHAALLLGVWADS
jgi:hypothetical protein